MLCGQGHFAHQVGGDKDRTTLAGQRLEQVADPADPLGVKPVDRLVQDDGPRITEQRSGDAEPLAHPEREPTGAFAGYLLQADRLDHLNHPGLRQPTGLGQRQQVVVRRPAGVDRLGLEQRTHLLQRSGVLAVGLAVDGGGPAGRLVQAQDHPHRGGFPRPVGPQEPGDDARTHAEAQIVHGPLAAVLLGQATDFNHDSRILCTTDARALTVCAAPAGLANQPCWTTRSRACR